MKKILLAFVPVKNNPQTGNREINGIFVTLVVIASAAFFYYGFLNKKTDLVTDTIKAGIGVQDRTNAVYDESAPIDAIERRDESLREAESEKSQANPNQILEITEKINEEFEKESAFDAKSAAMTEYQQRLEAFKEVPRSEEEIKRFKIVNEPEKAKYSGWVPFSVRKERGQVKETRAGGSNSQTIQGVAKTAEEEEPPPVTPQQDMQQQVLSNYQESINFDKNGGDQNFLPLGTYIPAILLEDIITTDLQQYVTVSVAQDVTFRKRLQLPKGAVSLRGRVAAEPVQNVVDIHFDVMIFADGTELPCSGVAYSALDIRYPDRFRTRGVPGEIVTPPLYVKAKALYYTALAGGLESYLEDTQNQTPISNGRGDIVINPPPDSGNFQEFFGERNPRYVERALARGTADTVNLIKDDLQADLEKYRPYLKIEKGTPFFIQLEQTVNLDARTVNGLAKAQERERQLQQSTGLRSLDPNLSYPPGDARATYQPLLNPQGFSNTQNTLALPPGRNSTNTNGNTPVSPQDAAFQREIQAKQLELLNQASDRLRSQAPNPNR